MEVPTRNIYKLHCKGSVQRSLAYPQFEAELCRHVVYIPVSQSGGGDITLYNVYAANPTQIQMEEYRSRVFDLRKISESESKERRPVEKIT
jgi:hypothetical protein